MKKFALALSLCALCASYSAAALLPPIPLPLTIDGYVFTDPYPMKIASMPIPGVKVYLQSQLAILQQAAAAVIPVTVYDSSFTDATGHVSFPPVTTGSYTLSFQHSGYASRSLNIYPVKDTTLRISLVASGAHGVLRGKVIAACGNSTLARPCLLVPIPKCTVTVMLGTFNYSIVNQTAALYPAIGFITFAAVTNDSGVYSIDSIPISSNDFRVTVSAAKGGFVSQSADTGLWNLTTTTVNFELSPVQGPAGGDSVYTVPAHPTQNDSITYNFYDSDACCCALFVNPAVMVQDTMVLLSFSVNSTPCQTCRCVDAAGKSYSFKGGRLKAGRYGIYRQEGIYCPPGQACPPIAFLPVKIGEVVVTSTAVSHVMPVAKDAGRLTFKQERNMVTLECRLDQPSHLRLNAFNARGTLIGQLFNGQAGSGTHDFSWTASAQGVYFLSVEIDGVAASSRRIVISR